MHVHSAFFLSFFDGPQNSKSLKYWANDEPGFMSDLLYSTKILLKRVSLHKTSKTDLIFMNMSKYQKSTLGKPTTKKFVLQSCFLMHYLGILIYESESGTIAKNKALSGK